VPDLDAGLEQRSKAELIALIKQMVRREPNLELLLEAAPRGKSAKAKPETYHRQATTAFRNSGYDWGSAGQVADELDAIQKTGDGFLQQNDFAGAAAVYQGICQALMENYESVQDEEGDLHGVVERCVEGLAKCLQGLREDPVRREAILRTLWEVSLFDIEQGGIGLGEDAPEVLIEQSAPEERRTIAGWVREAMPQGKGWSDNWHRQGLGSLLLDLEADTLDDEAFLRVCRETGRTHDLVDRLLQLGRLPEAVTQAEQASDYDLLNLADVFVRHHQGDVAERLMQERSEKTKDRRINEWLKQRAVKRGDTATALELSENLFRLQPSLLGYQEVRKLAKKQGRWSTLQPELLAFVRQQHDQYLLPQIFLDEGDIDQALEAVQGKKHQDYGFGSGMELEVAKAAEKSRPRAALEIYGKHAESLINYRGRQHYQSACQFLKKMRSLYERLNESAAWNESISRLRERHGNLPALLEELRKAKL
jgi:hypothetical protein